MFNFSKKIDKVFIDKIDGNTIKTLDDTIKPINDYINKSNPIDSLGKDLHDRGLTFENFSDQDLGHIILFFLTKNLPKEIEDMVGAKGINKLNKTNRFLGMPNSFTGINPNWGLKSRKNSFLESLFDRLPLYFSSPAKIKQIIHFVVKYFHESLTSNHVIKIIKSLHNDSIPYIVANFIHFDLFRKIKMNDFIEWLQEKKLEGLSSDYLSDLINGYMERKSKIDDVSYLRYFVLDYNKEKPEDPIKGTERLINYHIEKD